MAVESNRGGLATHWSPVGMRVLAVDDNETCLEVLETMLRKCEYQVTTARHAEVALRLLKENRNRFDLVITDVQMPDTDGFELLEIVGLEMDLPVIMLSAHTDMEHVMRGVTRGACDYLSKPVRMQELRNIWQHVIRRKKLEPDYQISTLPSQGPGPLGAGEGALHGSTSSANGGQSENSNGKRKEHSSEYKEEDGEEEEPDSSRQKKPRVNWTQEKHEKFLIAVSQLGFEKAVPKKILDLMKVEGLTRENVASHLQKYRISLRKMQTRMAAQGGNSSSYTRMAGFKDVHSLDGSARFSNASLLSYPPGGPLSRLNSLAALRMHGVQQSLSQNLNNSFSSLHSAALPSNQNSSLFQALPSLQNFREFNSTYDPTAYARSNPLVTVNMGGFGNQSSLRHHNSVECWQSGAQLPLSGPLGQRQPQIEMSSTGVSVVPPGDSSHRDLKLEDDYNYGMNNSLHPLLSSDGVMDQNNLGTGMEFLLERTKSHDEFMESLMNTLDKRDLSATTLLDGEYI